MERGEIWLVPPDPTVGHEQRGKRPVLVVSPAGFNSLTRLPVVVPVTSGGAFARSAGFAVSLDGAGTKTTGVVRCDQPRTLDIRSRKGTRLESVPQHIIDDVLARLAPIFNRACWSLSARNAPSGNVPGSSHRYRYAWSALKSAGRADRYTLRKQEHSDYCARQVPSFLAPCASVFIQPKSEPECFF